MSFPLSSARYEQSEPPYVDAPECVCEQCDGPVPDDAVAFICDECQRDNEEDECELGGEA